MEVLNNPQVTDLMYGGAKGGGKSWFFCRWAYVEAQKVANELKIPRSETPVPVGFLGRKRGTDFTKTTLETWKKAIPRHLYRLREHQKEIIIDERVKIFYGGLDDEVSVNKFNSAEFAFVGIDQAEEISRTDLALLKGTLRLTIDQRTPKFKVLLTANPAPCFLKQDYILNPPKDGSKVFIQALPADNPYLPESYAENLSEAFKHRPELVQAYVHGSWDQLEGSDILIKHSWCVDAVENHIHVKNDRKVTVCDIARMGNDETVIYNMTDNKIVKAMIFGHKKAVYSTSKIIEMARNHNSDLIAIDADGMGGPVLDFLEKMTDIPVLGINSGKDADDKDRYTNSRSEMWFHLADKLAEGECCIPNDQILIGQLSSLKYNPNAPGGKSEVEPKRIYKKRMEGSPDRADAFVYGVWATSKVPKSQYDYKRGQATPVYQDSYGWDKNLTGVQEWSY